MRTLLIGGVKSGKSTRALRLSATLPAPIAFLATATAFDDEMRDRIARHKAERDGRYRTIEEPLDIDKAIESLEPGTPLVLDCVPLWLNNMFFQGKQDKIDGVLERFIESMPETTIIVTNEIGLGVIPADAMSREYGIRLGRINATLAAACDAVELLVAGIPLKIK